MSETQVVTRTGNVTVKASRLDPVYQTFAVQQDSDGDLWYYHKQIGDWHTLPNQWKRHIKWGD